MGVPKLKASISVESYLRDEILSPVRNEFVGGETYAMAGASDRHHRICANVFKKLDDHLETSRCEAFMTELKLKVDENTLYYPDVFVACDEQPANEYYREHPVLIVEVISPSTRHIDRREKLKAYQQIPSVIEYLVIEQEKLHLELHRRQPDGSWVTYLYNDSDLDAEIELLSVGLTTGLADIYRRTNLF